MKKLINLVILTSIVTIFVLGDISISYASDLYSDAPSDLPSDLLSDARRERLMRNLIKETDMFLELLTKLRNNEMKELDKLVEKNNDERYLDDEIRDVADFVEQYLRSIGSYGERYVDLINLHFPRRMN